VDGAETVYYDERYKDLIVVTKDHGHQMFRYLSDGQRIMVSMVGDLARRVVALNPYLGRDVLKLTPGIVSIDELGLHLHPKWQRRVNQDLKRFFPSMQLIATTPSPQLVGEALPREIRILENGVPNIVPPLSPITTTTRTRILSAQRERSGSPPG
jgi:predicted ATP-binding protein involved in virulence